MKNKLLPCICVLLLALSFGCAKTPPAEKAEVIAEPFESMPVVPSYGMYIGCETEKELFDSADLVIVGAPTVTFTDGEERFYNGELDEIDKDSGEKAMFCCTVRDIAVFDMLKGEAGETVKVADEAITAQSDDGTEYISGLDESAYIAKKNVKYIYYLSKPVNGDMDFYLIREDRGLVNVDGLDDRTKNYVDEARLAETRERYAALFEKYGAGKE